jgi:hypothetical protein
VNRRHNNIVERAGPERPAAHDDRSAAKEEIEQQRVTAFMAALLGHEVLTKDSVA